MVYDALDFLTFVQTTGGAVVEAFDASVDDVVDDAYTYTKALDLGAAVPNWDGQSVYIRPRRDVNGDTIDESADATVLLIATLFDGASTTPATERATATQFTADELLEMPLPRGVKQHIRVGFKSDGGAGTAHITKGAFSVKIGASSMKES
jgi:hypothetical protein